MKEAIVIREASERDLPEIREIFTACYADHYAYPKYYDETQLKRLIFDRDVILLVAECREARKILGTASVILDIGAWGDLIGEFGRLAVHPDGRGRGVGSRLMEGRLARVRDRLHIGIVENRPVHPFSQRISDHHGFSAAGFLPSKNLFAKRENVCLYLRHFGNCLDLRRNHPHLIPEVWPLADEVLRSCGIGSDAIVDEETPAYSASDGFELEEMTSEGYTSLLHFERGRVRHREIFGPVKLHVGLFQLRIAHYQYLLARSSGHLVGGIGYHIDETEKAARILELVSADQRSIRFLLEAAVRKLRSDDRVEYLEVDVSAYSPEMQRTLLELGFLPAAYLPAMTFHRVERLDGVRMVQLMHPLDFDDMDLHSASRAVADIVVEQFRQAEVVPEIEALVQQSAFFQNFTEEQSVSLSACASIRSFDEGDILVHPGENDGLAYLLCSGLVEIAVDGNSEPVGAVGTGDMIGELSLLQEAPHHVMATVREKGKAVVFERSAVERIIRRRPDIGVLVFRNLASQLGKRLLQLDGLYLEMSGD